MSIQNQNLSEETNSPDAMTHSKVTAVIDVDWELRRKWILSGSKKIPTRKDKYICSDCNEKKVIFSPKWEDIKSMVCPDCLKKDQDDFLNLVKATIPNIKNNKRTF